MSTVIFYFSGTGNSLFVAKQLRSLLTEAEILPIENDINEKKVRIQSEIVILCCPVYFQSLPDTVKSFVRKLELTVASPYICGVVTCNGGPGHSLYTLDRMLKKKGHRLNSGFTVDMPGNSLIVRDFTNPPQIRARRLGESYQKISKIAEHINARKSGILEGHDRFKYHLQGLITVVFAKYIYRTPVKFRQTQACKKCEVCLKVCPRNNIRLGQSGIEWGRHCEHCLACFHWCPNQAIEIGHTTIGKLRYHHPEIKIQELFKRS